MSAEILNAEINKILDFFLIPDSELEMKDKILKNIDNELSFSDEFPEVKSRGPAEAEKSEPESDLGKAQEDNQCKGENQDDFIDVVEENAVGGAEKNEDKEKEAETEKASETNNTPKSEGVEAVEKVNEEPNANAEKDNNVNVDLENENINNKDTAGEQAAKAEEQPSDRIELLEYLLEFIESEDDLNYVLAGYFSKFFITLLNRNSGAV